MSRSMQNPQVRLAWLSQLAWNPDSFRRYGGVTFRGWKNVEKSKCASRVVAVVNRGVRDGRKQMPQSARLALACTFPARHALRLNCECRTLSKAPTARRRASPGRDCQASQCSSPPSQTLCNNGIRHNRHRQYSGTASIKDSFSSCGRT